MPWPRKTRERSAYRLQVVAAAILVRCWADVQIGLTPIGKADLFGPFGAGEWETGTQRANPFRRVPGGTRPISAAGGSVAFFCPEGAATNQPGAERSGLPGPQSAAPGWDSCLKPKPRRGETKGGSEVRDYEPPSTDAPRHQPPTYRPTDLPIYRPTDLPTHRPTDHRSPITGHRPPILFRPFRAEGVVGYLTQGVVLG